MYEISTSILNVKEGKESETILALEKARTDYFHIDVMDGKFVKKDTYNKMKEISSYIKRISNLPIDVHLMVEDVKEAIEDFLPIEPNIITFHLEALNNEDEILETIKFIKNENIRVGIAIKPNTELSKIYKFLPYIHIALVMTVEPGKGGQTLITDMIDKTKDLKKYIKENNLETIIEVDGGINLATSDKLKTAGADILVAGTAILMANDYKSIIDELKK